MPDITWTPIEGKPYSAEWAEVGGFRLEASLDNEAVFDDTYAYYWAIVLDGEDILHGWESSPDAAKAAAITEALSRPFTCAQDIRDAVDAGKQVRWEHDGYHVTKTKWGEYLIVCQSNQHAIGLTWSDGTTLNGKLQDFYILEDA